MLIVFYNALGTRDLVPGLKLLEDTRFEMLELHLGELSPMQPGS